MRKVIIVLLGIGVAFGFAAGFARLGARGYERQQQFRERIADACTEAALRVWDQRSATHSALSKPQSL